MEDTTRRYIVRCKVCDRVFETNAKLLYEKEICGKCGMKRLFKFLYPRKNLNATEERKGG